MPSSHGMHPVHMKSSVEHLDVCAKLLNTCTSVMRVFLQYNHDGVNALLNSNQIWEILFGKLAVN